MTDPVKADDGHNYQRSDLTAQLLNRDSHSLYPSPFTGRTMQSFVENPDLKQRINGMHLSFFS